MVVDGIEEVEADLLDRIRKRLGAVPIGVVFDFHANISDRFVQLVDVFAGYDTYPHVDPVDRGVEVAGLLARRIAGGIVSGTPSSAPAPHGAPVGGEREPTPARWATS